jgi:hypothetical protein
VHRCSRRPGLQSSRTRHEKRARFDTSRTALKARARLRRTSRDGAEEWPGQRRVPIRCRRAARESIRVPHVLAVTGSIRDALPIPLCERASNEIRHHNRRGRSDAAEKNGDHVAPTGDCEIGSPIAV